MALERGFSHYRQRDTVTMKEKYDKDYFHFGQHSDKKFSILRHDLKGMSDCSHCKFD